MIKKKNKFKFFFAYFLNFSQLKQNKGFTLTELLIAVSLAAIVISSLLTAMVQILQSDNREKQKTRVQQQTQSALNYITQDLKQAVYIYDNSEIAQYIPDLSAQNATPILVFWKNKAIPESQLQKSPSTNYTISDCNGDLSCENVLRKRSQYVLVAYYQSIKDSDTWQGNSRIIRYELPKYSSTNLNKSSLQDKLKVTTGYVDPSEINNDFTNWPIKDKGKPQEQNRQDLNGGRPVPTGGELPVLVDFIDSPDSADFTALSTRLDCSTLPRIQNPDPQTSNQFPFLDQYQEIPNPSSSLIPGTIPFSSNSFYTCVRTVSDPNQSLLGVKQSIAIYLRGNEQKKGESNFADTFRPVAQTQITIGGIVEK